MLLRRYYILAVLTLCSGYDPEMRRVSAWLSSRIATRATYALLQFVKRTAGGLFLLDRLEFSMVDLLSGDEQVEPRVEFFQMRILGYYRVNIFHV